MFSSKGGFVQKQPSDEQPLGMLHDTLTAWPWEQGTISVQFVSPTRTSVPRYSFYWMTPSVQCGFIRFGSAWIYTASTMNCDLQLRNFLQVNRLLKHGGNLRLTKVVNSIVCQAHYRAYLKALKYCSEVSLLKKIIWCMRRTAARTVLHQNICCVG